jgi:acetyl esterase/lipase
MAETEVEGMFTVPARNILAPAHLSPGARAALVPPQPMTFPAVEDKAGWEAWIAKLYDWVLPMLDLVPEDIDVSVEDQQIDGVPVFISVPADPAAHRRPIVLEMHGGALISGGGPVARIMSRKQAARLRARLWSVDYRMPPHHPYPAGLDDGLAVYRALLKEHRAEDIVVAGNSAGGNLAAALILRARDEGLPMPGGALLMTPEVDLTESGDSFNTLAGIDMLGRLMPANLLYANGHDLTDPYLSPLFGDFAKGFPPTLLTTGTRDLFLSNTVRMHRALRAADIRAELHVLEAAPHAGFLGTPEDAELTREIHRFLDQIGSA